MNFLKELCYDLKELFYFGLIIILGGMTIIFGNSMEIKIIGFFTLSLGSIKLFYGDFKK